MISEENLWKVHHKWFLHGNIIEANGSSSNQLRLPRAVNDSNESPPLGSTILKVFRLEAQFKAALYLNQFLG